MKSRFTRFVFAFVLLLGTSQIAQALTPKNRELLEKEFADRGAIVYDLYAPLGSVQVGVALIETGQPDWELLVLKASEQGKVETVLSEAYPKAQSNSHPFTLLYNGRHLLTYHAKETVDERGATRLQGDLVVRDIADKGDLKELFMLRQVVDLKFSSDGMKSETNLLWQPATHFLNQPGRLPHKYNYFRFVYKRGKGEYQIFHHLEPIPNATTEEYANFNNRAIIYYFRGLLVGASRLLEQAWNQSGYNPVVVQHNQDFVKGELNDLEAQVQLENAIPFDDALLYYWQGEFALCLQVLAAKEDQVGILGLADLDLVLTGLVLAQQRRWIEADRISLAIDSRGSDLLADYLCEMARIAGYQGLLEVEGTYLMALEVANADHPGYIAGVAGMLRRKGELAEAQRVLETYLRRPHDLSVNLLEPSRALYSLYLATTDHAGMEWLIAASLKAPLINLLGYANLVDYWDLSNALVEVIPEERERILMPKELLDRFGVTQ